MVNPKSNFIIGFLRSKLGFYQNLDLRGGHLDLLCKLVHQITFWPLSFENHYVNPPNFLTTLTNRSLHHYWGEILLQRGIEREYSLIPQRSPPRFGREILWGIPFHLNPIAAIFDLHPISRANAWEIGCESGIRTTLRWKGIRQRISLPNLGGDLWGIREYSPFIPHWSRISPH